MAIQDVGPEAWESIRRGARKLIGHFGFTKSDREELEQEFWLDLVERRGKFSPALGTWPAFAEWVVRKKAASIIEARKAGCRDYRRHECSLNEERPEGDDEVVELGDAVAEAAARRHRDVVPPDPGQASDLAADLAQFAARLPEDLRDIFLRLRTGTPTQVAQDLGIPRGTLYEALEALRRRMGKAGFAEYL